MKRCFARSPSLAPDQSIDELTDGPLTAAFAWESVSAGADDERTLADSRVTAGPGLCDAAGNRPNRL